MQSIPKFDPRRPYGTIVGHQWARYEQNGHLYDFQGRTEIAEEEEPKDEFEIAVMPESNEPKLLDFELENAKEFLRNILAGGPITKTAIFKECEGNNQQWPKVQEAFEVLHGEKVRKGNWTLWKLPAEQ